MELFPIHSGELLGRLPARGEAVSRIGRRHAGLTETGPGCGYPERRLSGARGRTQGGAMRGSWLRNQAVLAAALALAAAARAAAEPAAEAAPAASAPPAASAGNAVALDQLLTLPTTRTYSVERKGGLTRGEWRTRYGEVNADLAKERAALEAAEAKLDTAAGGQWKVNPIPGADASGGPESPLDFQLRSELRKHREEIERLERKLRQLDIEANLAGVPEDWKS
jgi:hypothetical protein